MSRARHSRIIACAGGGKTTELTGRIVGRLVDGAPPDSLLAFTFTEKAASELRARIVRAWKEAVAGAGGKPGAGPGPDAVGSGDAASRLPPTSRGLFVGTIHSWCLNVLRRDGGRFELYEPLSEEREWSLLLRVARRLGIVDLYAETFADEGKKVASAVAAEVFQRSLDVVYNERIPRERLGRAAPRFAAVVSRYEDLLDGMRAFSFGSMIDRCVDELERPGSAIASLAGEKLEHVFVDEFQDLNPAQGDLLEALTELGASVHVVGDDDQAIYQWRGGDVDLFRDFPERFRHLGGVEDTELGTNYRSLPHIVTAARAFTGIIDPRIEKPIGAHRRYGDLPEPLSEEDRKVETVLVGTPEQEATWIVGRIRQLMGRGVDPGEIAILYRSVRTSAGPVAKRLREEGIPVEVVGRLPLLDRPAMRLMADVFVHWAGGSWYPVPGLGEQTVNRTTLENDLLKVGHDPATATRLAGEVVAMGERLGEEGVPDLVRVFDELVARLGLLPPGSEQPRRERSLGQFSSLLTEFEHAQRRALPASFYENPPVRADEEEAEDELLAREDEEPGPREVGFDLQPGEVLFLRLKSFLQQYATHAAEERPSGAGAEGDAVTIMTIHQAKGLEWPVVFLPSLVDRRFPSSRLGQERDWYVPDGLFPRDRYEGRLADEARLFYVGMTRARDHLLLSAFTGYDSGRPARPSPFLRKVLEDTKELCAPGPLATAARSENGSDPEPLETDFGRLATYDRCGFQYWLRHECGFQPPIATPLGFGRLVHHVVAELARRCAGERPPTAREADEILADAFYLPFAGRKDRETLFESARQRLRTYVSTHGSELVRSVGVEREFDVPLEGGRVRGRVDLLLRAEGGGERDVEIVDFKTAAERPPPAIHHNQLRLYAEALGKLGYNPVRLYVHALDPEAEPARQEIERNPGESERFRRRLGGWIEGIQGGAFDPCEERAVCPECDFRRFCPWAPEGVRGGART